MPRRPVPSLRHRRRMTSRTEELDGAARSLAHCGPTNNRQIWQDRYARAASIRRSTTKARRGICAICHSHRHVKATYVGHYHIDTGAVCHRKLELYRAFRNAQSDVAREREFVSLGVYVESQTCDSQVKGEDIWEDEPRSSEEEPNTDDDDFIDDSNVDFELFSDGEYTP